MAPAAPATLDPRVPPIELLALIGPEAQAAGTAPACSSAEAMAYCRGLARGHYENFSVLTGLVPERLRDDFAVVYAFCRWSDDLGDETGTDAAARARSESLLAWWRGGLRACESAARGVSNGGASDGAGAAAHPVFVA
ncbi:MAG: squalene/phytoene synthase family protein, partial [Phycisphaerales bacterium]|nr:squalene/phytoene synthase family protein [Phycisphaerales bacterium]